MRYSFCAVILFLLVLPINTMAKKKRTYTTKDIISNSDSLLRKQIGDTLFQYCKLESGSYYTYKKGSKLQFESFDEEKKLSKKFDKAYMRYEFLMPYGECPLYDTISGLISIEVQKEDTVFRLHQLPDINFIPEMAVAHEACTFISKDEAIKIALQNNIIRGVNAPDAILKYIPETKRFAWLVLSLIWNEKNVHDDKKTKKDVVMIDAVTGEILKHAAMLYEQEVNDFYNHK